MSSNISETIGEVNNDNNIDDDIVDVSSEEEELVSMTELVNNMVNKMLANQPTPVKPEEVD